MIFLTLISEDKQKSWCSKSHKHPPTCGCCLQESINIHSCLKSLLCSDVLSAPALIGCVGRQPFSTAHVQHLTKMKWDVSLFSFRHHQLQKNDKFSSEGYWFLVFYRCSQMKCTRCHFQFFNCDTSGKKCMRCSTLWGQQISSSLIFLQSISIFMNETTWPS